MANTRAKRPPARTGRKTHPQNTSSVAFSWLVRGLLMGIFGAIALYLVVADKNSIKYWISKQKPTPTMVEKNLPTSNKLSARAQTHKARKTTKAGVQKKEIELCADSKERFEFYKILPGMEVPLPEIEESPKKTPPSSATPSLAANPKPLPKTPEKPCPVAKRPLAKIQSRVAAAHYFIQAGAFRNLPAAAILKKRLNQQGMSTHIQKIEEENGTWFRVTVGPFASESMALTQKNRLAKEKIQGILILQR